MPNLIKALRLKRGLTQEELARKVNVTRTTIVFWEQGKANPKSNYIRPLAKALRCKATDLI